MSNKFKILIIEDEKILSDVLKSKLEKEGYEVAVAVDGDEGLNKLKLEKPDLALLDIVMPKVNGYEVLEKIQEEKINIPIIVISNSGQPVEIEKIKKMGAVDYLIKTKFNPIEVVEKVKKYLGEKGNANAANENQNNVSGQKKILLVEDDTFLRDICGKKLVKEGFSVFEAADGEQALANLEKFGPDIILLDIILPTVDGFEVLSKVRANKDSKIKATPVIMLSNLGQEDDVKKALSLGATDYMIKAHFTTEEIAEKVKKELGMSVKE